MNEVMAALRHPSTGHPAKFPYPPESRAVFVDQKGPMQNPEQGPWGGLAET